MTIRRAVPDIASQRLDESRDFYVGLLGFEVAMDLGSVMTFASPSNPTAQVTLVRDDGSSGLTPQITVEVDDVDALYGRAARRGDEIVYPLTTEPWGVRRFFVRDPNGTVVNVMHHVSSRGGTGRRFAVIPEAHLLLFRDDAVLLLQRQNTGYEDGNYGVIAGHIEAGETAREAMSREAREEAGLLIDPPALSLRHVMHRRAGDDRVSFFFAADRWTGEPRNMEPDRCSELRWFRSDALPANTVPYVRAAIGHTRRGISYSEFGW